MKAKVARWLYNLKCYRVILIHEMLKEMHLNLKRKKKKKLAGEGNGNPLQYFCLENPMDGGAWLATVHRVTKSQTWLSNLTHTHLNWAFPWDSDVTVLRWSSSHWKRAGSILFLAKSSTGSPIQSLHMKLRKKIFFFQFKLKAGYS